MNGADCPAARTVVIRTNITKGKKRCIETSANEGKEKYATPIWRRSGLRPFVDLDGGPGLIRRVANIFERTVRALRLARYAQRATMVNHLMREVDPFLLWDDAHQVLLDVLRIILIGKLEPARDAMH